MKQTVRHGLGIALSAMAFLCNYSPWVREAASLPDALTLTSGQKFVVQTGRLRAAPSFPLSLGDPFTIQLTAGIPAAPALCECS